MPLVGGVDKANLLNLAPRPLIVHVVAKRS